VALSLATIVLAGPAPAPAGAAVLKDRLPNGLTVVVRENPAAPVVAISLFVRVGEISEGEDTAGLTHFLHQVMIKGTTTRSAQELAEAAERIGGGLSASGETDASEIRGTALARHWPRLLELIADVALSPSLAELEIQNERRALLAAIRSRADQPFPRAFDTLKARVFGDHPYALPSLGRAAAVERVGRQDLIDHYRRTYRPGLMILSVSGEVPAQKVREEAARLFGGRPPGQGGPEPTRRAAQSTGGRTVVSHQAAQTQVLAGVLAPAISHPDYAAVKVLTAALGGGTAGRLFSRLRDQEGLAYSTGAFYPSRVEPSLLVAYLGTAPANAERAEEGLRREVSRLRVEPLSAAELERAKGYLLGQFALDRRTNARLAWYAGFFESAGVGHDFAERYIRAVEAVTVGDVERVARLYLDAPTVVTLGPPGR
jgi:predicted Zn-dependent peptidase